jgi:hypothetical protein
METRGSLGAGGRGRVGTNLPSGPDGRARGGDQGFIGRRRPWKGWRPGFHRAPAAVGGMATRASSGAGGRGRGGNHLASGTRAPWKHWRPWVRWDPAAVEGVATRGALGLDRRGRGGDHVFAGIRLVQAEWDNCSRMTPRIAERGERGRLKAAWRSAPRPEGEDASGAPRRGGRRTVRSAGQARRPPEAPPLPLARNPGSSLPAEPPGAPPAGSAPAPPRA